MPARARHNQPIRDLTSGQGSSAAGEAYHHQPHARYAKRERLAIFEWIRVHAKDRIQHQPEKIDQRSVRAVWRRAAETWLRCQGLITVSINHKVLPNLPRKYVRD